jgi:hydrogenase maturation protein HypF
VTPSLVSPAPVRLEAEISGLVQGVGFRPQAHRLAGELGLSGWVGNDVRGVTLVLEGPRSDIERFLARLGSELPPLARIDGIKTAWRPSRGERGFAIRASDPRGDRSALLLPEAATCEACRSEIEDPANRRYRYPFTNCTHCGPRFSIIRSLPYDRAGTTMAGFAMCPECAREYQDPADRRFHAQPNACPRCGPRLAWWDAEGREQARDHEALRAAAAALAAGAIVAVKGIGGFHLMADARDAQVVSRLRQRKQRMGKPFALLVRDVEQARAVCVVSQAAATALAGMAAPIVLMPRRPGAPVAREVAPGLATLGVMIASHPLHLLLTRELDFPLVATSGNRSDEPLATDEREALNRLAGIADAFLVHDRPIERHVDDSVAWELDGGMALLRRARGHAPLPVTLAEPAPCVLAVGGHLKTTVALAIGPRVFVSQHIGDLETVEATAAFERVIADFVRLYDAAPVAIAHDRHPDYASTQWARRVTGLEPGTEPPVWARDARLVPVQHHHAHLAACLAEHQIEGRALGVVWDGTGYGDDGAIWGGEFLLGDAGRFQRVAHLAGFRLPGGDAAVREPRRSALALIAALDDPIDRANTDLVRRLFRADELAVLERMMQSGLHAPLTTSAGRLFDGLAAIVGLHPRASYEGEAAIAFEAVVEDGEHGAYPLPCVPQGAGWTAPRLVIDWRPMVAEVLREVARGVARGVIAARVHAALAGAIVTVAQTLGERRVALTGGCFQNRRLVGRAASALRASGFDVLLHRQVPPNDGGISLGQVAVAVARIRAEAGTAASRQGRRRSPACVSRFPVV